MKKRENLLLYYIILIYQCISDLSVLFVRSDSRFCVHSQMG